MVGLILVLIAVAIWVGFSTKIVGPDEMAVRVIFGKPINFCDSGFQFVPSLPGCRLVRYPKKLYVLDYSARDIVSKAGIYNGEKYGSQVLGVDSTVYLRFPRDNSLIEILKAQVPIEDKALKNWSEEVVVGALRVALGRFTWKEATENMGVVSAEAEKVFQEKDGALLMAGFKLEDLRLVIKEIKLPKRLEEALPGVDTQRLEARAAPFEAEQRATETIGSLIYMMAEATGKSVEDIRREIDASDELKKELRVYSEDLVHRRMAIDGRSYVDIRVTGAEGLEKVLLDLIAAWKRMPMGESPFRERPRRMKKVQAFGVEAEVPEEEEEEFEVSEEGEKILKERGWD